MNMFEYMQKLAKRELKMKPLKHQSRVSSRLNDVSGVLVFHGLGSGKTFTSINAASQHGLRLIVIAPASLRENFRKEIKNSGFKGNFEVLSYNEAVRDMNKKRFQNKISNSLVVYDEVHNAGRSESSRSKLLNVLNPKKTLMLTGTPIRNFPSEMVPIMQGLKIQGAPSSKDEFNKEFIESNDGGIVKSLMNVIMNGENTLKPKNISKFKSMMSGKVDYYNSLDPKKYPNVKEETVKVEMDPKHLSAYDQMMSKSPLMKFKVEYGIKPKNVEKDNMMAFMIGPRMIANTPAAVNPEIPYSTSSKIKKMLADIKAYHKKDKKFKGMAYSNFLTSGISGLAEGLKKEKIPFDIFTGEMNDAQKREAVKRYNEGKTKMLLISGAGAEGIDLKGTKMVQIMEPHWNNARIRQAIGRAARYMSHSHLPKKDRKVVVKKYVSTLPKRWWETLMGFKGRYSADQYLYDIANDKDRLNDPFLRALESVGVK